MFNQHLTNTIISIADTREMLYPRLQWSSLGLKTPYAAQVAADQHF